MVQICALCVVKTEQACWRMKEWLIIMVNASFHWKYNFEFSLSLSFLFVIRASSFLQFNFNLMNSTGQKYCHELCGCNDIIDDFHFVYFQLISFLTWSQSGRQKGRAGPHLPISRLLFSALMTSTTFCAENSTNFRLSIERFISQSDQPMFLSGEQ